MSKLLLCDICGSQYDLDKPHFELVVPAEFITQHEITELDVCSADCLIQIAKAFTPEQTKPTRKLRPVTHNSSNGQIEVGDELPPSMEFTGEVEKRS